MNLRSQAASPQIVVSLIGLGAAVAVKSAAFWWNHREQRNLTNGDADGNHQDKDDDDEETRLTENKDSSFQQNRLSDVSMKYRSRPIMMPNHSDDASVTSTSSSHYSSRINRTVTTRANRSNYSIATKRRVPRVRDSLLPWNNNSSGRAGPKSPIRATQRSPMMRDTNRSAIPAPKSSIFYDDSLDSPSDDSGDCSFTFKSATSSKSQKPNVPRVRESLLPWSSKNRQNDLYKLRKHMSPKSQDAPEQEHTSVQKPSILYDDSPLDSPSESVNSNFTSRRARRAAIAPRVRDSLLPWKQNDNKNSSIPSPNNSLEEELALSGSFVSTRSPLMDSTNNKKSRTKAKSRRESKEQKELNWKKSAKKLPLKAIKGSVKSPTLMKLSSRNDKDGVRSLQKVFEHSKNQALCES